MRGLDKSTFRCATQQDIDSSKDLNSLCNRSTTLSHYSAITLDASYSVFPTFPIFTSALTLVYQLSELEASFVVLNFMRWQTCCNIVSMGEQLSNQSHSQWRHSRGNKPYPGRVVHSCDLLAAVCMQMLGHSRKEGPGI